MMGAAKGFSSSSISVENHKLWHILLQSKPIKPTWGVNTHYTGYNDSLLSITKQSNQLVNPEGFTQLNQKG